MRTFTVSLFTLALVFFLSALPAKAAEPMMNHNTMTTQYSDRAFLSGMIAHHEGAIEMAKLFLNTPENNQDPRIREWAAAIIHVQTKEIAEMKTMLAPLGGIDDAAYTPMQKAMQTMIAEGKDTNPNMCFVTLMLPHHAMALEMSVPALLYSTNPKILNLAETIIISQAKEMRAFKAWISENQPAAK